MAVDAKEVIDQAESLLEEICVHPSEEPLAGLRRLRENLPETEEDFVRELHAIFAAFGDRHTHCRLPEPYLGRAAFLPFLVSSFYERDQLRIGVTTSCTDELECGDVLTAWNGKPLDEVLLAHGAWQLGANPPARFAKAVQTLTFRPLALMPLPQGPVVLELRSQNGRPKRIQFDWEVAEMDCLAGRFASDGWAAEPFCARTVETSYGPIGWIRIGTLQQQPSAFLKVFVPTLERIPQDGVVLDLRGCEEGIIQTAEQLAQLFSPVVIRPLAFEFRLTGLVESLISRHRSLARWRTGVLRSASKGEAYSEGHPITTCEEANAVGRRYKGSVVVLVDALTYSSAEMLAVAVQDHSIGLVLGTSPQTGGGGASPWKGAVIFQMSGIERFRPLPNGPEFRVAVRRCRRGGIHAGQLLEGTGVIPDVCYTPTAVDFHEAEKELKETAGRILAEYRQQR